MSIGPTSLQTRNSTVSLKYKEVPRTTNVDGVYVLEILDNDESHEFSKLVSLHMVGGDQMDAYTFDSYDALEADHYRARQARWVKTNCSTVRKFLR